MKVSEAHKRQVAHVVRAIAAEAGICASDVFISHESACGPIVTVNMHFAFPLRDRVSKDAARQEFIAAVQYVRDEWCADALAKLGVSEKAEVTHD